MSLASKLNPQERKLAIAFELDRIPESARREAEHLADRWRSSATERQLWKLPLPEALDRIESEAKSIADKLGLEPQDEFRFGVFQLVALSLADSLTDPEIRAAAFPWLSILALLYAATGGLPAYLNGTAPFTGGEPIIESIGEILTQLGYVVLFAGVATGRFGALRLRRRLHTLAVGTACWLCGVLLVNIPFVRELVSRM